MDAETNTHKFEAYPPGHNKYQPGIAWEIVFGHPLVPDAVIVAGIGTMSRMTSAWQLPFRPRNGLVKIPGKDNDYCEVVVLGPLTGPLPRRQYNVAAQGDAAEGVLCYDPSTYEPKLVTSLATTCLWVSDGPLQLDAESRKLIPPFLTTILDKAVLTLEDVQSLCWHRVPLHNFHDSPFYGIELRCWVNGVLQEAGFIYLNDGLLAALLVDFFSQADGNLPINFEDPELRKQVLRALLWMYKKKDASGLVKVQSNKIRNSAKRGAFLAVMRSAGLTNTVPELRPWAVQAANAAAANAAAADAAAAAAAANAAAATAANAEAAAAAAAASSAQQVPAANASSSGVAGVSSSAACAQGAVNGVLAVTAVPAVAAAAAAAAASGPLLLPAAGSADAGVPENSHESLMLLAVTACAVAAAERAAAAAAEAMDTDDE